MIATSPPKTNARLHLLDSPYYGVAFGARLEDIVERWHGKGMEIAIDVVEAQRLTAPKATP